MIEEEGPLELSQGLARARQEKPIRRPDEDLHLLETLQRDEDLYHLEKKPRR